MSHMSALAKLYIPNKRYGKKYTAKEEPIDIDRTETSFGGHGCLTKEQCDKALSLYLEMQKSNNKGGISCTE